MLSLQECIEAIKKEYPDHYPYAFVEVEGKYVFSIVPKGMSPQKAISDMHIVDPKKGVISGSISIIEFLKNEKFRELWKKPNLVTNHDESLTHSGFFQASATSKNATWGVKRSRVYPDYIEHHGIKGQKWGVQNGPPYPLDKQTHNQVVDGKKRNARAAKGASDDLYDAFPYLSFSLSALSLLSFIGLQIYVRTDSFKENTQKTYDKNNKNFSKKHLSDIADVDKKFDETNPPRVIRGKHSAEDDMSAVNPKYDNGVYPGTTTNCVLCSTTYDLRRRGYDVTAMLTSNGNFPEKIFPRVYDGAKEDKIQANSWVDYFEQAAEKYPNGSRGEIHAYGLYLGHSMAWEINNGKLEIFDTQRNVKMTAKDMADIGFNPKDKNNGMYRLDNLDLKIDGINLTSAELKPDWKKTISSK